MSPLLGRGKKNELENELLEQKEKNELLERRLNEVVEKTEKLEKGARLLTEAVYKIITYLKDFEWPMEEGKLRVETKPLTVSKSRESMSEKYLTETERKIIEEINKKGALTVSECYTHVGRSKEHVSRLLKKLVDNGILLRERKGKTFYYRLAEK